MTLRLLGDALLLCCGITSFFVTRLLMRIFSRLLQLCYYERENQVPVRRWSQLADDFWKDTRYLFVKVSVVCLCSVFYFGWLAFLLRVPAHEFALFLVGAMITVSNCLFMVSVWFFPVVSNFFGLTDIKIPVSE